MKIAVVYAACYLAATAAAVAVAGVVVDMLDGRTVTRRGLVSFR